MPKTFLLVHGACHGAWCWDAVVPILEARGHRVLAIDLPGRNGNGSAGWGQTLQGYGAAVAAAAAIGSGPVVAVAHSMGGQMISQAAEQAPERFERLVYVSAFLPKNGDRVVDFSRRNVGSELVSATRVSLWRGLLEIIPSQAERVFYHDCAPGDVARALAQLVPESLRPSMTRIRLSAERFGSIPRSYIRCSHDRALTLQLQDWMIGRQPCQRVETLAASHSPFLSQPAELCDAIESVSA